MFKILMLGTHGLTFCKVEREALGLIGVFVGILDRLMKLRILWLNSLCV